MEPEVKQITVPMNYYQCDHITLKASLSLLKNDMSGQRVYSSLWQMTRDVLMISLSLSAMASLALFTFGIVKMLIDLFTQSTPLMGALPDVIIFSLICPALFVVPLTWVLAYFGWYRNMGKIEFLLQHFISSLPEVEKVAAKGPNAYTFYYREYEFMIIFKEKESGIVSSARGAYVLVMPYVDTKKERAFETLYKEIQTFVTGKCDVPFGLSPDIMATNFICRPLPSAQSVKKAADLMIYVMGRFNLRAPLPDEPEEDVNENNN